MGIVRGQPYVRDHEKYRPKTERSRLGFGCTPHCPGTLWPRSRLWRCRPVGFVAELRAGKRYIAQIRALSAYVRAMIKLRAGHRRFLCSASTKRELHTGAPNLVRGDSPRDLFLAAVVPVGGPLLQDGRGRGVEDHGFARPLGKVGGVRLVAEGAHLVSARNRATPQALHPDNPTIGPPDPTVCAVPMARADVLA